MASRELNGNQRTIAQAFVAARRGGIALPTYPGTMPDTLAQAYAIQDAAIALSDRTVVGWKVGRINPPREGMNRLAGPIFADQVLQDGQGLQDGQDLQDGQGDGHAMPVIANGFAAAEAEFLLRIGTAPDPARASYTIAEARALIDAVHVGIEIASSPYPGINSGGATVTISDFGNNNGLLVGAAADDWQSGDISAWTVELSVNGDRVGHATAADMLDGPFGAARFLFEHMAARGIALSPGQWISSGAVTGVHVVNIGDRVEARFDARFALRCTIVAQ